MNTPRSRTCLRLRRHRLTLAVATAVIAVSGTLALPQARADDFDLTPLRQWIEFQSGVRTLKTTFTQERQLRTIRRPIRSEGTFWLQHPDKFRWQVDGDPPKMIAYRDGRTITVLHPKKMEAERIVAGSGASPALDFLAEGFPRSVDGLLSKFDIVDMKQEDGSWHIDLKPSDSKAALQLQQLTFIIDAERSYLKGFELELGDGSTISTFFTRQEYNGELEAGLFVPALDGYTVEDK